MSDDTLVGQWARLPATKSGDGDEWYTPDEVLDAVRLVAYHVTGSMLIDLDPCGAPVEFDRVGAVHTIRRPLDGTTEPWPGRGLVWCNPPYSDVEPWMRRCEFAARSRPVILHVPPRVETKAWWSHFWSTNRGCMVVVKGRIKYHDGQGEKRQTAKFPTVFLTWDERLAEELALALGRKGFSAKALVPAMDLPF